MPFLSFLELLIETEDIDLVVERGVSAEGIEIGTLMNS
jgi:hypothetical protein